MGNSDSQLSSKDLLESNATPKSIERAHQKVAKHRSLSPEKSRRPRESSLQNGSPSSSSNGTESAEPTQAVRRINPRRAKSFRNPNRTRGAVGSFRAPVCPVTGLTTNQKKLICLKWREMERSTIIEMGRNVFETIFRRDSRYLRVIGLEELADNQAWRNHVHFRIHVQRFCETLNEVIRTLEEPSLSIDRLLEFGAWYAFEELFPAHNRRHVPSAYWDAIVYALNNAAKDLQVQSESSRGSESPTVAIERRFLLPDDSPLFLHTPPTYRSVCPLAAEAWNLLAIYVATKIRFGYEMERLLQAELRRLRAAGGRRSSSVPTGEEDGINADECGSVASRSLCSDIADTDGIVVEMVA